MDGPLVWRWGPVAALMSLIFWLSAQPALPAPPAGLTDKQVHALVYGLLALLIGRALSGGQWSRLTVPRVIIAVGAAVIYGVSDEWHQSFVPGRTSEVADIYADAVGAAGAGIVLWGCGIIASRWPMRRADTSR